MRNRNRERARHRPSPGFTLVELLVVILIVVILSVATLSAVLPSFNARRVSEASRILQAALSRARDAAVRFNSPQGIRLLPDPPDPSRPGVLTSSRFIEMESGDAYDDGIGEEGFMVPDGFDANGNAVYNHPYYAPDQYYAPPAGLPPYFVNLNTGVAVDSVNHYPYLVIRQVKTYAPDMKNLPTVFLPTSPTSWFYNIRQGEKLQLNDSGNVYTVAGPICAPNSTNTVHPPNVDRLINFGPVTSYYVNPNPGANTNFEFLFLVNGLDDDKDGYQDEGFDGIDNDNDGVIDPGFNGLDDDGDGLIDEPKEMFFTRNGGGSYPGNPFGLNNIINGIAFPWSPGASPPAQYPNEYEHESFVSLGRKRAKPLEYTITRRPVPSQGSRETALPTGVVIDLTTYNFPSITTASPERSVLPVDPNTFCVDIMVAPNGSVIAMDANANAAPHVNRPFFHFWLTDIEDVAAPLWGPTNAGTLDPRAVIPNLNPNAATTGQTFILPMMAGSTSDPRGGGSSVYAPPQTLKGDRRLLSINTRTGAITSTLVETFYVDNTQYPYEAAERGIKDVQP